MTLTLALGDVPRLRGMSDLTRAGDESADIPLQPYDFLNVKEVTDWGEQQTVTVQGEVRFPGDYPIRKGETLQSVVERAGRAGRAEPRGDPRRGALLEELRAAEPVGRLTMDLPRALRDGHSPEDRLFLQDGDVLMVPGAMQSVTVIGQVQSPTSHLHDRGLGRDDYVMLSGGFTQRADRSAVYVIRANGQVAAAGTSRWFRTETLDIMPGDTIVAPMDVEKMRPLPLWAPVTTIICNLAVSVAAVNSF